MKRIFLFTTVLVFSLSSAIAQDWKTDFEAVKEIASQENKPIILVFQGSDWCAPCIKLDRAIWSTESFKNYAKDNYVMLKADFPRRKKNALSEELTKTNAQLAEIYNKNGIFPFVVVLDSSGMILGETSYKKVSVPAYIDILNSFIN